MGDISLVKKCIFCYEDCSGSKRAKEHIFPQHIQRRFSIHKAKLLNAHSKVVSGDFAGGHISILPPERQMTFSGFLAGSICSKCNNGWMSDLETKVIPFIYDLIEGYRNVSHCNNDERNLLALWAFKTSAVLSESTTAPQNRLLPRHAEQFYKSGCTEIPKRVAVFAYSSETEGFLWSLSPTWQLTTHSSLPQDLMTFMSKNAYKIFIQLGRLMLVTCYWPSETVTYTKEQWAGFELTNNGVDTITSYDTRDFFEQEAEAFLMSISAEI
ncbi:hypothetical protein GNP79_19560 [Aliivibrio fischeri]|uniref:Uncharacterized protein n=2 Tax=Aliivibrio fischeri TaxID=668 RepID=A0A6N3Z6U4_ALIFS|nr:hypothetical protein [Aliivibrio fischeri]MUK45675.1 hypothetical protein [Aliivibrio fischeri]MUK82971.1 hypothetical protein [Aliivibrio fischeri]MUK86597.1 hypothetical protein [Aliivibrio fischeri]